MAEQTPADPLACPASFTPVMQTLFYEPAAPPDKQRGNCHSAIVASLLHLPIEAVPNFVQDDVNNPDGSKEWWRETNRFVRSHGAQIVCLRDAHQPNSPFPLPEPGEPYTVVGVSPRDPRIHHIVLYVDGQMVHDPHPDGTGICEPLSDDYRWTIRPETKQAEASLPAGEKS